MVWKVITTISKGESVIVPLYQCQCLCWSLDARMSFGKAVDLNMQFLALYSKFNLHRSEKLLTSDIH